MKGEKTERDTEPVLERTTHRIQSIFPYGWLIGFWRRF